MSNLKTLREARGWRREDLAAKSGLSLSSIYLMERPTAGRPSRTSTRRAVARALGVPEAEIWPVGDLVGAPGDRKSTRLNSSHLGISYAVFCLKKKKHMKNDR